VTKTPEFEFRRRNLARNALRNLGELMPYLPHIGTQLWRQRTELKKKNLIKKKGRHFIETKCCIKFTSSLTAAEFITEITMKAAGVFLWVALLLGASK
jgi:hypothetical protein